MARHRRQAGTTALGWVAAAGVAGAAVLGGWVLLDGDPDPATTAGSDAATGDTATDDPAASTAPDPAAGPDDCTTEPVTVWVAPAAEPAVTEAAEATSGCPAYEVTAVMSADASGRLSSGDRPDVWIPDATVWAALAGDEVTVGPVLASSPVVLAGPADYVEQVRAESTQDDEVTGWSDILRRPDQPLRVAEPTQDPASLAGLLTVANRLDAGASSTQRDVVLVSLAQRALEQPPTEVAPTGDVLVPMTHAQAEALADDGVALLEPAGGAGAVAFPWVEVGPGAADAQELAQALQDEDVWRGTGLQAGAPAESVASPDPAGAAELLEAWERVRPLSRMLVLIDVSGSMDAVVGEDGQTRFDLTMDAAAEALPALPPRSQVGLWWFSTHRGPDGEDWVEELPLAPMDEDRGEGSHRERLLQLATSLDEGHTTGDTGLHDSLWAAYRHMQSDYDADYRNSVVVLTDGINDDPDGGLTQAQLVDRLRESRDEQRPVDVIVIGMGPDMRAEPMREITDAVGGTFQQVEEATQIREVLASIIANRPA